MDQFQGFSPFCPSFPYQHPKPRDALRGWVHRPCSVGCRKSSFPSSKSNGLPWVACGDAWLGEWWAEKTNAMVSRVYVEHVDMIYAVHSYRYTFAGNYLRWKKGTTIQTCWDLLSMDYSWFTALVLVVAFGKPAEVAPGVDDSAVDIGTTSLILGEEGRSIGLGAGAGVAVVKQAKNRTGTGTTRSNQTIPTKRLTMHSQLCLHYALVALGR